MPSNEVQKIELQPMFGDARPNTGFDAHYVYHTSWAARRLYKRPVEEHIDFSSDLRFVTIASSFQKIKFFDYRPAKIQINNLETGACDLLNIPVNSKSLESVSCMHVVEHIGLGRYGDKIDYNGSAKAISELQRILKKGGVLYFVVPVGAPKIMFNAHRIFCPEDIVKKFNELELIEFSLITDQGRFIENIDISSAKSQNYACGCFIFTRKV